MLQNNPFFFCRRIVTNHLRSEKTGLSIKPVASHPNLEHMLVNIIFAANRCFTFAANDFTYNCQLFFKTILHTPKVLCPTFGVHFKALDAPSGAFTGHEWIFIMI